MAISTPTLLTLVRPLRMLFWGGLLYVLDINFSVTSGGTGWSFDFLNDFVGMLMITWGVFQFDEIVISERYEKSMSFVKVVSIMLCIDAFSAHFVFDLPSFFSLGLTLLSIAALAAFVLFCLSMRWLCEDAQLQESVESWKTTTVLAIVIYLIPLGIFYLAVIVAVLAGTYFHLDLGPMGLLVLSVFLIPLIHLFVSTSRMKREIKGLPAAETDQPVPES